MGKIEWQATIAIRASRQLKRMEKDVWVEDHALDRGATGCYLSDAGLATRLGCSVSSVKRARRALVDLGLEQLGRLVRVGVSRVRSRFVRLPAAASQLLTAIVAGREDYRPSPDALRRIVTAIDTSVLAARVPGTRRYPRIHNHRVTDDPVGSDHRVTDDPVHRVTDDPHHRVTDDPLVRSRAKKVELVKNTTEQIELNLKAGKITPAQADLLRRLAQKGLGGEEAASS